MISAATKNELAMMLRSGRLNRLRFISYLGFLSTVKLVFEFILILLLGSLSRNIAIIISLAMLLPFYIWWMMRRMNDVGVTGKLIIFAVVAVAACFFANNHDRLNMSIFASAYFGLITLMMMLVPGDKSANEYGEIPLENVKFNKIFSMIMAVVYIIDVCMVRLLV